jgi:septum formation protein
LLILASASPRRREILANAGIAHQVVVPSGVDESVRPGEDPVHYVRRLALEKAHAVQTPADDIILAADTSVVVDGEILGKPQDQAEARWMIHRLSGREHTVLTGICLRRGEEAVVDSAESRVRFISLSEHEVSAYVASGEPMDKAGGYGIQTLASKFVERIDGCYFNVMGLPVALVYQRLRERGWIVI